MLRQDLKPYLEDLKARKVTNRHVAKILNVSEAHLSRTLKTLIQKDAIPKPNTKHLLEARKALRAQAANTLPVKEAAKRANCSERTIYRYRK